MTKLSIVIPAFNEERTLAETIHRAQAVNLAPLESEIIVVDNNSSDQTFAVANGIPGVKVVKELIPGKGAAVKRGFQEATGDILLIQDADLEYNPKDYPAIIAPILWGETEAVLSIRTHFDDESPDGGLIYNLGNNIITWTTNWLYWHNAGEYTGGYKVFTKRLVDSIKVRSNSFAYEHELVCKILKRGYKPIDVPIHYNRRDHKGGKKINWRDGFKILWAVVKYRFVD